MVIGTSCAGKTTLARDLGKALDIPWTDLDDLWWNPNWVQTPVDEFRERASVVGEQERWVVSGGHTNARAILWPKATHIVWLNYSFPVVFNRAFWRTMKRCWRREVVCNGNTETFRQAFFTRDSILFWVITSFRPRRREVVAFLGGDEMKNVCVVELRTPYRNLTEVRDKLSTQTLNKKRRYSGME